MVFEARQCLPVADGLEVRNESPSLPEMQTVKRRLRGHDGAVVGDFRVNRTQIQRNSRSHCRGDAQGNTLNHCMKRTVEVPRLHRDDLTAPTYSFVKTLKPWFIWLGVHPIDSRNYWR